MFKEVMRSSYSFKGKYITLGGALINNNFEGDYVNIPLKTLNRHGLISGATGSGKTKTLQVLAEQMSENGIPVLLMDIKGDLSGVAAPGKDVGRNSKLNLPFSPTKYPVEFLSISEEPGVRMRSTVSSFGPTLFSNLLGVTDVQSSVLSVVFKYAEDNGYVMHTLKDFKKLLNYVQSDEIREEVSKEYGGISTASIGALVRKITELESQGADKFFGAPEFDVQDLEGVYSGKGIMSVVRLTDIQTRPKLFSTFMLKLLHDVYKYSDELGDPDKPKLCIFIDEAHLVFNKASEALLDLIETTVKLIRSKGVGLFFVTQNPNDIPESVLGQLGMKIQHSLRAFTAKDRRAIKLAAENFPLSDFYDTESMITSMGIGEALVTCLNEKGIPTELAHTSIRQPNSRMGTLSETELEHLVDTELVDKYRDDVSEVLSFVLNDYKSEHNETHPTSTYMNVMRIYKELNNSRSSYGNTNKLIKKGFKFIKKNF